jgi:hypothetical protein
MTHVSWLFFSFSWYKQYLIVIFFHTFALILSKKNLKLVVVIVNIFFKLHNMELHFTLPWLVFNIWVVETMEFSQSKIARFNRKQKIKKANQCTSTISNTGFKHFIHELGFIYFYLFWILINLNVYTSLFLTENVIPMEPCMNQNNNIDIDLFKRKANRVPLSPLTQGIHFIMKLHDMHMLYCYM